MVNLLHFIKIKIVLFYRMLTAIGVVRVAFIACAILPFAGLAIIQNMAIVPYNYYILVGILLLIFVIHRQRKDFYFVFKLYNYPVAFFLEYLLANVFVLAVLLFYGQYVNAGVFSVCLFLIACSKPSVRKKSRLRDFKLIKHIPVRLFEWRSGVRLHQVYLLVFYVIGLFGFFNPYLLLASDYLLVCTLLSFYTECEPRNVLEASECSAHRFMCRKLWMHTKCTALFLLPLLLISFVHYDAILYAIALYVASVHAVAFGINLKYAFYAPSRNITIFCLISMAVYLVSAFPPLFLLMAGINIYLYFQAVKTTNTYLYAYN